MGVFSKKLGWSKGVGLKDFSKCPPPPNSHPSKVINDQPEMSYISAPQPVGGMGDRGVWILSIIMPSGDVT